ncbi:MAG: hypothetical protein K2M82_02840, partial [Lachnospiraceae bacterium]|nr:hypothetical protein [Lachnospiraceae bacterium]
MLYIKRILAVFCFVGLSISAYAAVTPLNKSEYGVRGASLPSAAAPQADCPYDACPPAYIGTSPTCSVKSASSGVGCERKKCCDGTVAIEVDECPSSYTYRLSDIETAAIYNLAKREYCVGYRNGIKGNYFKENPQLCSMQGITSDSYLNGGLNSSSSCGSYSNMTQKSCINSQSESLNICVLSKTTGYPKCLTGDTSYHPYPTNTCGSGTAAIPCYVECGDGVNCLGFTCRTDTAPECSALEAEKKAEGYYSSGVSDTKTADFDYICRVSNDIKYMGFFCPNYWDKSDCENSTNNGTIGASCSVKFASGSSKTVYTCSCGTMKTLDEFCQASHPGETDCKTKYYGVGKKCTLDKDASGNALVKYERYENTIKLCSEIKDYKWVKKTGDCTKFSGGADPVVDQCRPNEGSSEAQEICKYCQNFMTENDNLARDLCKNGTPVRCYYGSSSSVYMSCSCDTNTYKSKEEWCAVAPYNKDDNCKLNAIAGGTECHTKPNPSGGYYSDDVVTSSKISCQSQFKTKTEWCAANASSIISGYDCLKDYTGKGTPCKLDATDVNDQNQWKYASYALGCPIDAKKTEAECKVDPESDIPAYFEKCSPYNEDTEKYETRYICKCPPSFGTTCPESAYQIRGGLTCTFDRNSSGISVTKYEKCQLKCGHAYAYTVSDEMYGCPDIDTYVSSVRGGVEDPQKCFISSNSSEQYICACPSNFKTVDEWCDANYIAEGMSSSAECARLYTGRGTKCERDIEVDTAGNPVKKLTKYAYFIRNCPSNRPLYYSEEDCRYINGEYEYSCNDTNGNERVVCQCPSTWFTPDGSSDEATACTLLSIGDKSYAAEASGETCDFDGSDTLKYEQCVVKCNDILKDTDIALPNAYTYLSSDNGTPTPLLCANQMGNGAVFGLGGTGYENAYCSLNHTTMYPCYCPADYQECLAEHNEVAADGAKVCSINGKTYYSKCQLMACPVETPTLALVAGTEEDDGSISFDMNKITKEYGDGAQIAKCSVGGKETIQVTCDPKEFSDPCDYPYEAPKSGSWCKYGDGTTLMKNGRPHYKAGSCRVQKTLGVCGKSIAGAPEGTNYSMFVASTESECTSKYGPGISTQLCEYGAEQGYKRAYNCYYDPTAFKYTTANCGVRHDLTGNYIIINGQKHWNQCNCASAYKHHKFNCGGLLSGNPCQQELNQSLIAGDSTLKEAVEDNFISATATLPFYPYCQCSADYKEICDEDGSGRYKGVGQACNGKYVSCECVPDKLPDNWTDNYYGCPGGKKPTGVWKDNGCGKKYYQCSVVECTWEYTEMCAAPLIPVGQSCQDNEGNIGGYKACTCPDDYKVCPMGQVGEGEPCNLKGVAHYKSCKSQDACTSLSTETCTGPLQVGINPCTRDGITYYESCVCANGYSEVCGEGEVGVGNYCELDGKKYYRECVKPDKTECTEGHVTACDTNQESYSPCVSTENGKQVVKYLCKCPSNWKACDSGSGEHCTQKNSDGSTVTYCSECNSNADTCTAYQNLTYSVCTSAQTGDGGSCTIEEDGQTIVKYATCKDSDNCLTNGFRFSCSGYDPSALGESCIDANGNKLYKSCPCPSSYTTCSNPNASKGTKCVPLEENGNFGEARYSTCECDRSKYKYTCQNTTGGSNKGIRAPKGNNYCEVEEQRTEITKNEDGVDITTTVTDKVKYYTSCECDESYKYTCSDGDHGEKIPAGYENDYCQINTTKFYRGCDCSNEYNYTAKECSDQPGQKADTSLGSCTIKGVVYTSSSSSDSTGITGDLPLVGEGSSSVDRKPNTTYYKGCICKSNYTLSCTPESLYDTTGIPACELNDKVLYPKCLCKSEAIKTCAKSGKNQGITHDERSICSDQIADANGHVSTTPKYTACTCAPEYGITAETCDNNSQYDQTNENYCDAGLDTNGYTQQKTYKQCLCDPKVYDNNVDMGTKTVTEFCAGKTVFVTDTEFQSCIGQVFNAETNKIETFKHPNKNLCCTSTISDDAKILDYGKYDNIQEYFEYASEDTIKNTILANCGHAYNATIELNCAGTPYYKCINSKVASDAKGGTVWYSKDECSALNMGRTTQGTKQTITNSWLGTSIDVYPDCDCDSKYKYTDESQCSEYYATERNKSLSAQQLFCTLDDYKYTESSERKVCPESMFKLYTGDTCIDKN